ncbi:MAG TPA: MOSC domain-containing protein [Gammaproteobacteria bacterium]|jgi:MOSC domain-containing protein YiiM
MNDLKQLLATLPQRGRLQWIGLRPGRRLPLEIINTAELITDCGIRGDRSSARQGGKRQVTLIQQEHLPVIAGCLGNREVGPEMLRRNLMVSGINLLALKDRRFRVGEAELEYTGICAPCSFMEEALGTGGYNAVRGHGGITARILSGGLISVGDEVYAC